MTKILGCDLSLNHGAVVELTDGSLTNFWYYTDIAGAAKRSKRAERMPKWKTKDRQIKSVQRLAWIENYLDKSVFVPAAPEYVGIEDYALDAAHGGHYQGEVGGIARILCWFRGYKTRLHDPVTVKMFGALKGTADKDTVERVVNERYGVDFGDMNPPKAPKAKNQNRQTSQDLCDAFVIAQMVWTEVLLREGSLKLSELHEKELRVFNRVTKAHPVNLLDREWIENPDGVPTPHGEPVCETCGSRRCCLAGVERAEA